MRQIYVVLGLSRSGTSAITRALQALGINLEGNLQPARNINPKGFFEDIDIMYGINRKIKHINGEKIITADCLTEDTPVATKLREMLITAENLLQARFGDGLNWGFKDVKTGEMLPFWWRVFNKMNINDSYIIALRHPLSRAHSNQKFNHHDIEHGLLAWLEYLVRVVDQTQGKNRVVVSYELILQQPQRQLKHMHEQLAINTPINDASIELYASQFLDKKLRHFDFDNNVSSQESIMAVCPLCMDVYELLMRTAKGELSLNSNEFAVAWQKIKIEYQKIEPLHQYINRLIGKEKTLQRQLRKIQKSVPWKLIYPLRWVDNCLRKIRLAKRERDDGFKKRENYST